MEKTPTIEDTNEEKILFEWEAAERAFKRRDRDFWITIIAILILVSVILIFIKEFFLIIALVSILFLGYVLATVPPEMVKNKISNRGIYFGEQRYPWEMFLSFCFKNSLDSEMLLLETNLRFPRQIALVINPADKDKIKGIVVKRIPYTELSSSFVDRLSKWFIDKLPLENREK